MEALMSPHRTISLAGSLRPRRRSSARAGSSPGNAPTFRHGVGYTTVMGRSSPESGIGSGNWSARPTASTGSPIRPTPAVAHARLELPDGALLQQMQFWAYDTHADWITVSLQETCQAVGFGPPSTTDIATADTFGVRGLRLRLAQAPARVDLLSRSRAGLPDQEGVVQLEMPDGASMGQFQQPAYDEDPTYGLTLTCSSRRQGVRLHPAHDARSPAMPTPSASCW